MRSYGVCKASPNTTRRVVAVAWAVCLATGPTAGRAVAQERGGAGSRGAAEFTAMQAGSAALRPFTRPVSVHRTEALLRDVLEEIANLGGLGIAYGEAFARDETRISLDVEGVPARHALDLAVRGTPWQTVAQGEGDFLVVQRPVRADGTLRGRVTQQTTGQPVVTAQIVVEGTGRGGISAEDGTYVITRIPEGERRVTVQRIGYESYSGTVSIVAGQTAVLDVRLEESAVSLEGVVVTATGVERRRAVGHSLSTLGTSELSRTPAINAQQLLSGRVTGATVLTNSGQPGAGATVRLRGVNSISQGNSPIVYVDGVRIFNGHTSTNVGGRQFLSPLNDIPVEDIERMEVVKGPAATTLYGTEASGGVIQIFTKRGASGAAQWSAEVTGGFNEMGHLGRTADAAGLFVNTCRGPDLVMGDGTVFEDSTCPASGTYLRKGAVQRYQIGVTGGTDAVDYYVSGNFHDERGVLPRGGVRGGGLRANIDFSPIERVKVTVNSSIERRTVEWIPDGLSSSAFLLNVSRGAGSNFKASGCANPEAVCLQNEGIFAQDSHTTNSHFITGGTVTWQPTDDWTNRLAVGYDYNDAEISTVYPFGHLYVSEGAYYQTLWNRTLLSVDLASTWHHRFGSGLASTSSVGGQIFDSFLHSTDLTSEAFAGPSDPTLITGALRSIDDVNQQRVINAGFFLQEMVAWKDRLFVTGGLRVDGNSAFGRSFGLQAYPKLSVAYDLSDEGFWPSGVIPSFKLRGAWGESGKAPGAFDAVQTWDPVAAEDGKPAFTPAQVGNPQLGPERTREIEVGFDAAALDGRLGVTYTYYDQHTLDALVPVVMPPSNGFTRAQLENVGELFNHGHELGIDADVIDREAAALTLQLKFTSVRNEVGDIGGQTITIDANSRSYVREGLPAPAYIGPKVMNPDEFADPVIEEDQFIGGTFPTRIISPSATLRLWDRLTIDAFGEWQLGGHLLNAVAYQNENILSWQPCYAIQDKLRAAADGDAHALDDVTALWRARCTLTKSMRDYALWVEKADFFKLRSVTVSYALPDDLVPGTRDATLSLTGSNLFTSTDYTGTDPEVADQRNNTFSRRDYYVFPPSRTFTATLRVRF